MHHDPTAPGGRTTDEPLQLESLGRLRRPCRAAAPLKVGSLERRGRPSLVFNWFGGGGWGSGAGAVARRIFNSQAAFERAAK